MKSPWEPYRATDAAPWDLRRVVHLHRRAGFAATWNEIQHDLKDGPDESLTRLLNGTSRAEGLRDDFDSRADAIAEAATTSGEIERLQAWWLFRMLFTPDPLQERLTLLWHNHFATSQQKIRNVDMMRRQNDALRKFCRAPFAELLHAMLRDPALLLWLDAPLNKHGGANENLGRELMELFTLGIGNYSERDVKEASRALTGWSVAIDQFRNRDQYHDAGQKTILGKRGAWDAQGLVGILLDHPATSRRLAWRLCDAFLGEGAVNDAAIAELAAGLREKNLDMAWGVATVLRSCAFFADSNISTRVPPPPEFLIGSVRALEMFDPPPSTLTLAEWLRRLGQDLFAPPNVGGWTNGRAWLTPRSVVARGNCAAALVAGEMSAAATPLDLRALAARHGATDGLRFFQELLFGRVVQDAPKANDLNHSVALLLAGPDGQLA